MVKTRDELEQLLYRMILPVRECYTPNKAGITVGVTSAGYEDHTVPMEGWSRILWGLVPLWKGNKKALPEFQNIYREGLAAGTDPSNEEYWGDCHDVDQRFVEMAAIAYGLLLVPDILWEPLSEKEKEQAAAWLLQINGHRYPENNWQMFAVLVNIALKKLGMPYSQEQIDGNLAKIESFYEKDGWYTDGISKHHDYYVAFAIHFYSLIYAMVMEEEEPERCRLFKERAKAYGKDFIYWFAEDGSAIAYGRSLTYRFAQGAYWSACLMAGVEPFSKAVMKGIVIRHLEKWLEYPIFDKNGLLTIGYGYPQLYMQENYNAPGSPYWGLKTFALLALPEEDELWSMDAGELPALENVKFMETARMVATRQAGNVCFYPDGKDNKDHSHFQCKYSKFVYSSLFGFCVPKSNIRITEAAPDSALAFEIGGYIFTKRTNKTFALQEDRIVMTYDIFPGVSVETEIIPREDGHTRIHHIHSELPCKVYDCGFAVKKEETGDKFIRREENGMAMAENSFSFCEIKGKEGTGMVIDSFPNLNLLHTKVVIPAVCMEISDTETTLTTEVRYGTV